MIGIFRKGSTESHPATVFGSRGTALVVDDSPTEIHLLKKMLERAGYKVVSASDGQQGIAKAREVKPDIILMDVVMPILNGFQATRQLHSDPETAAIPIIMITTKDQETDRSWGLRQGACAYLVKPVTEQDLLASIKAAVPER